MTYKLCRHIKTNGTRCEAPALKEQVWCYFHSRLHKRHTAFRYDSDTRNVLLPHKDIELNALEDCESVQLALSVVINALATGNLESRRATALLYGLQLASNNAGRITKPYGPNVVQTTIASPEGLDLAEPGAIHDTEAYLDDYDDDDEEEDEPEYKFSD